MTRGARPSSFAAGLGVLGALAVAGFVMIVLGWRSIARERLVDLQLPGLVSGCIAGTVLVVVAAGWAVALHARRVEADHRVRTQAVLDEAAAVLAAIERRRDS